MPTYPYRYDAGDNGSKMFEYLRVLGLNFVIYRSRALSFLSLFSRLFIRTESRVTYYSD